LGFAKVAAGAAVFPRINPLSAINKAVKGTLHAFLAALLTNTNGLPIARHRRPAS
jgi:hypothetical protein